LAKQADWAAKLAKGAHIEVEVVGKMAVGRNGLLDLSGVFRS
jgi:hypothetical protein